MYAIVCVRKKKIRKENKAKNKIIPKHYKNLKGFAEHNFFCQWEHFNREKTKKQQRQHSKLSK